VTEDKPWVVEYLAAGQRFKDRDLPALKQMWYSAVTRANSQNDQIAASGLREMDDIEAEFNLRGLEAPGPRRH
jgi:hypothetical protein